MPDLRSGSYEDEIRRGLAGEDMEDTEIFKQLRAAARGEIDPKDVGRPKRVTEEEEVIADRLLENVGRGPEIVRRAEGPKKQLNLLLEVSTIEVLDEYARKYDYWYAGKGQIVRLIEGIGQGKFLIIRAPREVTDEEGQS